MACSWKSEDSWPRLLPRCHHSARLSLRQPKGREANRAWSCHSVNHQGWLDAHHDRHNIALYLDDSKIGEGSQSCEGQDRTLKTAVISLSSWAAILHRASSMPVKYVKSVGVVLKPDVHLMNASECSQ